MKGLTNWRKIGLKYVRYDRRARLDKIFFLEIAAVNLIGTFIWGWRRNDDGWKDEPTGERAPSLSVHKMPRPSYEVDSVSLSTDPKVTESFWDYLNGRIDRLILWPSRKGYCSALYPFYHTAFPPRVPSAFRSWESWLSATRMLLSSCLYTHLVRTLRNVDIEYWYTQSNLTQRGIINYHWYPGLFSKSG